MSEEKISPSAWRKIIIAVISVLKAVLRGFANENDNRRSATESGANDNENRPKGGEEVLQDFDSVPERIAQQSKQNGEPKSKHRLIKSITASNDNKKAPQLPTLNPQPSILNRSKR